MLKLVKDVISEGALVLPRSWRYGVTFVSVAYMGAKDVGGDHEDLQVCIDSLYSLKTYDTPPKFNIAPEKWWLEDEFPFGIAYFLGLYDIC